MYQAYCTFLCVFKARSPFMLAATAGFKQLLGGKPARKCVVAARAAVVPAKKGMDALSGPIDKAFGVELCSAKPRL